MIQRGICKKEAKKAHLIFEIRQDFGFFTEQMSDYNWLSRQAQAWLQTKFVGPSTQTSKWSSHKFHKHILFGILRLLE